MAKLFFIHTLYPAQFHKLILYLLDKTQHSIYYLCRGAQETPITHPRFTILTSGDVVSVDTEGNGVQILLLLQKCITDGIHPDVIVGHVGNGCMEYLHNVLPHVPRIGHFEWYYKPWEQTELGKCGGFLMKNKALSCTLKKCSICVAPTPFQRNQYPDKYKKRLIVLHEGIDTEFHSPMPADEHLKLTTAADYNPKLKTITYIARGLEPIRGILHFISVMKVVFRHISRNKSSLGFTVGDVKVKVVGRDFCYYDAVPAGTSYKEQALEILEEYASRVEFLGQLDFEATRDVMRTSDIHCYTSTPFVLSWSLLEAMSCGALPIVTQTAATDDYVQHNYNGIVYKYFDVTEGQNAILRALTMSPEESATLRANARNSVVHFANKDKCNESWHFLIESLM